jgi:Tfp pilus assembly protein PilX
MITSTRHRQANRSDSGFVMPLVIIVLFVVAILTVVSISVATQASKSSARDTSVKTALAAAEAGLQLAVYRIDEMEPGANECITSTSHEVKALCEGSTESLANGASYKYWTTSQLSAGSTCVGTYASGVTQRCVTAEGSVSGLSTNVRLQTRVEAAVGEKLFSVHGILGLKEVIVSGSVKATAVVASNTKIEGTGSANFEKGFEICPGGKFTPAAGSERNKSGVKIAGVGGTESVPSLEKTRSVSECPITATIPASHPTSVENDDIRIATGEDPNTGEAAHLKYTASTHTLEAGANVNLTLKGSKYYFCKFLVNSNGILKIASGAKIEIFIDSHEDDSTCPSAASDTFVIEGNAHMENPNGATSLLIEVAGKGKVAIENSGSLKANIYAPESEIKLSGSGTLTGAIVGSKVLLEAGSFVFSEEDESFIVSGSSTSGYSRSAWEQCTSGTGTAAGC